MIYIIYIECSYIKGREMLYLELWTKQPNEVSEWHRVWVLHLSLVKVSIWSLDFFWKLLIKQTVCKNRENFDIFVSRIFSLQ